MKKLLQNSIILVMVTLVSLLPKVLFAQSVITFPTGSNVTFPTGSNVTFSPDSLIFETGITNFAIEGTAFVSVISNPTTNVSVWKDKDPAGLNISTSGAYGVLSFDGDHVQNIIGNTRFGIVEFNNSSTQGFTVNGQPEVKVYAYLTLGVLHAENAFAHIYVSDGFNGAITGGNQSSYFALPLRWKINAPNAPYLYPVGDDRFFQPVTLNFNTYTGLTDAMIKVDTTFVGAGPSGLPTAGNGTPIWAYLNRLEDVLIVNPGATGKVKITIEQQKATNYPISASMIIPIHRVFYNGTWQGTNGGGAGGDYNPAAQSMTGCPSCVSDAVKDSMPFTGDTTYIRSGMNPGEPLPITIISFTGENEIVFNNIHVITASEINSHHIEFQKSSDAKMFQTFETKMAAGVSDQTIQYNATDSMPDPLTYYRAIMFDIDGSSDTTNVIALRLSEENGTDVLYHNPSMSDPTLIISANKAGDGELQITNILGQRIVEKVVLEKGTNIFKIETNGFSSGMYLLQAFHDGKGSSFKFILTR